MLWHSSVELFKSSNRAATFVHHSSACLGDRRARARQAAMSRRGGGDAWSSCPAVFRNLLSVKHSNPSPCSARASHKDELLDKENTTGELGRGR